MVLSLRSHFHLNLQFKIGFKTTIYATVDCGEYASKGSTKKSTKNNNYNIDCWPLYDYVV